MVLLKQKIKNKNNIKHSIHRIPLSIEINESIYMASINDTNKQKKKRRRRRKKNKSMMVTKSVLDVEIINDIFIPSTIPVLEIECGIGISIPSFLDSDSGVQQQSHQQDKNLFNGNAPHAASCDDSTREEYQRYKRADFLSQAADCDSNSSVHSILSDSCEITCGGCDDSYCSNDSQSNISSIKQFNPCDNLIKDIKTHTGVMFNGVESQFIPLNFIAKDINDYAKQFGGRIGIDRSSLQFLRVLVIDDINTGLCSELQMDFNFNGIGNVNPPEFYPLNYLFDDLLRKCIQYPYGIGCDQRSLKELKFLFVDNPSSLNSLNNNKNKNKNSNNNNSINRNTRNNRNNKNNDRGHARYGRKRGRKKRQYKMVHKNKLQNAKFKQFGNNDISIKDYYNDVVQPNLVTAPAPRCATMFGK